MDVTNCDQEGPMLHVVGEDEALSLVCNAAIQQEMTIYQGYHYKLTQTGGREYFLAHR